MEKTKWVVEHEQLDLGDAGCSFLGIDVGYHVRGRDHLLSLLRK